MDNKEEFEISELVESFASYASVIKEQTNEILMSILDGHVPEKTILESFNLNIEKLQEKYDAIRALANEYLSSEDNPGDGASIKDYAEAIINRKKKDVEAQVSASKEILKKFISVKSTVKKFTDALEPFQDEAKSLLNDIEEGNIDTLSGSKTYEGSKPFITAVITDNLENDDGEVLIDTVSKYYNDTVALGVSMGKYSLPECIDEHTDEVSAADEKIADDQVASDDATEICKIHDNEKSKEVAPDNYIESSVEEETNAEASNNSTNQDDNEEITWESLSIDNPNELSSSLNNSHFSVTEPKKSKEFSASKFISEMKKAAHSQMLCFSMTQTNKVLGMTADYLYTLANTISGIPLPKETAVLVCEKLVQLGYYVKYSVPGYEDFYALSKNGHKVFSTKKSANFLKLKSTKHESYTPSKQSDSILSHVLRLKVYASLHDIIPNGISLSVSANEDFFIVTSPDNLFGEGKSLTFAGIISNDPNQFKLFMKALERDLPSNSLLIISGESTQKIKATIKWLEKSINNLAPERIIYTDFDCKEYYDYITGNEISKSEFSSKIVIETADHDSDSSDITKSVEKITESADQEKENESDNSAHKSEDNETKESSENVILDELVDTVKSESNTEESETMLPDKGETSKETVTEISLSSLIDSPTNPTDEEFVELIKNILEGKLESINSKSDVIRATLLAKTASFYESNIKSKKMYTYLLAATRLPIDRFSYSSVSLSQVMESENASLILAAYMQAMLIPATEYDFGLHQQTRAYLEDFDTYFPGLSKLKSLFNMLKSIEKVLPSGYTSSVLALLKGKAEAKKYSDELAKKASELKHNNKKMPGIKHFQKFYSECFGENSDIFFCLDVIENSKKSECELVADVLKEYCDSEKGYIISKEKIETRMDKQWESIKGKSFRPPTALRQQLIRNFIIRLDLIKTWVEHISDSKESNFNTKRINALKDNIVESATKLLKEVDNFDVEFSSVISWTLSFIIDYLSGKYKTPDIFKEFAITGVFSLDTDGIPIIDESMADIKFYSPWKNLLRHITSDIKSLDEAKDYIYLESDIFDNLNQLKWICHFNSEANYIDDEQIKEARQRADTDLETFKDELELAYTYSRIIESDKERLLTIMLTYKDFFYNIHDYGCWSQFLNSLKKEVDYLTAEIKVKLRKDLDARKAKLGFFEQSPILDEAEMLLEDAKNFAVTEEYMNRFDSGEREFSEELSAILNEKDNFADFLSDKIFQSIYADCDTNTGKSLRSFGISHISTRYPEEWNNRQKDNSKELIENWPSGLNSTTQTNIKTLLSRLGFSVEKVEKTPFKIYDTFKAYITPTPKSMSDYRHPISKFGTKMITPLNVVVFYGKLAPKELVNKVSDFDFGEMTLVLIDRPIDKASRRQISEIFHTQTSGQNPFIFIDQVLLLYLARFQETERLSILLKCALPYTTYQPFVHDGGPTNDEMFFGRSKELATILDPNGACIVYGGRQLGKTALLQRAEGRFNNPAEKKYAIYCDIKSCHSENEMVKKVIEEINLKTNIVINTGIDTIDGLRKNLMKKFNNNAIRKMLLLIDESDNFLEGISVNNFDPLQGLINLKRETSNDFKFVLAGLHNVCRAKNATSDNGVFGQLGTPLCIKPLSPTEALQLLSRPLRYLGFEIDRYPHLETILTKTNYYPGILQFFGYKLVEAFTTDYGKYYHAADGHPPFELKDDQLGTVMSSKDLNNSIKEKFRLSLKLDQRYFMLARCITMLYHYRSDSESNWLGYSVEEIKNMAEGYGLFCLRNSTITDYTILLDEMVEMGILSKTNEGLYRLRRNTFVDTIGANMDILDREIVENNTEDT